MMSAAYDMTDDDGFAEAEAALAALAGEYAAYAKADVGQMAELIGLPGDWQGGAMAAEIEALHAVAHNIKGQGLSFGYDLMTVLGEGLSEKTRGRSRLSAIELTLVRLMVKACERVLDEEMTGPGGARGEALLAGCGLALSH